MVTRNRPEERMGERGCGARRVMVVAEPSRESAAALQYALSHGVVEQDELILLYIENSASWRNTFSTFFRSHSVGSGAAASGLFVGASSNNTATANNNNNNNHNSNGGGIIGGGGGSSSSSNGNGNGNGDVDFLEETKKACEAARPKVRVRTTKADLEGCRDKASVILGQCKLHGVDVLIIGQRRSLTTAILGAKKTGGSIRGPKFTDTAEYLIENCPCTCVAVQRKGQNAGYVLNTKTYRNFWLLA